MSENGYAQYGWAPEMSTSDSVAIRTWPIAWVPVNPFSRYRSATLSAWLRFLTISSDGPSAGPTQPHMRRPSRRHEVQVLRDVAVADGRAEAFPVVLLAVVRHRVHLARHGVLHHGVLLQHRQRLAQRHRHLLDVLAARDGLVDV